VLLKKYIEHLQILEINKRKRSEKRQVLLEEQKNKKFEDYDWSSLLREGTLKKLHVGSASGKKGSLTDRDNRNEVSSGCTY
jgi:hypothetical protein